MPPTDFQSELDARGVAVQLPRFLHVAEYMPLDPEHPTQGAAGLADGTFAGTAFAGAIETIAIDKIARARPAMKGDEAFMAVSSQIPVQQTHPGALCAL
jgi:hypothetical protein